VSPKCHDIFQGATNEAERISIVFFGNLGYAIQDCLLVTSKSTDEDSQSQVCLVLFVYRTSFHSVVPPRDASRQIINSLSR
jgi:hypothetical protein